MTLSFYTERTESILSRARLPQESNNIPNDHQCFNEEQKAIWVTIAKAFGIDWNETGHTLRVVVKNGENVIYTPYIGSNGTEAVLVWGKVQQPLKAANKELVEMVLGGAKRPCIEAFIFELEDTLNITLMLAKGDSDNATRYHKELFSAPEEDKKNILRKALRAGKLHLYLSQAFERAKKLAEFAGKTLTVTGYELNLWGKFELITSEGKVLANTALVKKLSHTPEITPDKPATLEVGYESGRTTTGYPIFPVILTTQADLELPVFDFGAGLEDNVNDNVDFDRAEYEDVSY
ncbi:MAG: hypothetical protein KME59_21510 [Trichormus sp. ATA11-4-KO1]|jgi:hypothetical protein|nr:hypothetical protein [Trichormus sp. ATA11-4-KO1]